VYLHGRLLLHVLAGVFRPSRDLSAAGCWRPVDEHTLFMSYSVAKGVTAMALLALVDQGLVRYEDRVAELWPEFGAGGTSKHSVTVGDAVSHRAGLGSFIPFSLQVVLSCIRGHWAGDWRVAWSAGERFVEDHVPEFAVGTYARYHPVSFSWIIGGILQRVLHRQRQSEGNTKGEGEEKDSVHSLSVSDIVKDTVGELCGCRSDVFIGVLTPDEQSRVALLEPMPPAHYEAPNRMSELRALDSLLALRPLRALPSFLLQFIVTVVYFFLSLLAELEGCIFTAIGNSSVWRGICLPSSNGYFTAQAVAAMYGALANGGVVEVTGSGKRNVADVTAEQSGNTTRQVRVFREETVERIFADAADHECSVPMYDCHTDSASWGRHSKGFSPWPLPTLHGEQYMHHTLGHQGMGGCSSFGCAETGLAVCIMRNVYDPLIISEGAVKLDDGLLSEVIREVLFGDGN
jgi:CubicO group peptidase (beta-lactamase class C family)